MNDYQIQPSGYDTLKQLVEVYGIDVILDALNRIQPGCTDTATLRYLLYKVAPKCIECEAIATRFVFRPFCRPFAVCDQHYTTYDSQEFELGIRIKAALEE